MTTCPSGPPAPGSSISSATSHDYSEPYASDFAQGLPQNELF